MNVTLRLLMQSVPSTTV